MADPSTPTRTTGRPASGTAHLVLAALLPLLVLVQAALAGQHLFEGSDITLHGILGNVTFALTLVGVVLAVVGRASGLVFGLAVALVALSFTQVGLGYVGRDTAAAAAWHIPGGVTIFGLATAQLAVLARR